MKVEDTVRAILVDHLNVNADKVVGTTNIETDFDADSLDKVEIVMALEEEFSIEIPDDAAQRLETFDEIVAYIRKVTRRE